MRLVCKFVWRGGTPLTRCINVRQVCMTHRVQCRGGGGGGGSGVG